MKKVLLVLALLATVTITGCGKKEEPIKNDVPQQQNSQQQQQVESNNNSNWKTAYAEIIKNTSDTWDYNTQTKFGFAYVNEDEMPELVIGSVNTSILIYSYDETKGGLYLLTSCQTGSRGATEITYVEKENIIINKTGGMLFESEYQEKEGCIGGFASWGNVINLKNGEEESWNKTTYVFDENDDSKDEVETNISEEIENYLSREKEFELKYSKEEAQKIVYEL